METTPNRSGPAIQWDYVDGPLLTCSDGTPHLLTLLERLMLRADIVTIEQLDAQHNSWPCKP